MNPLAPGAVPDPNALPPKPWQKSPQQPPQDGGSASSDTGAGDLIDAGVEGASAGLDIVGGAVDLAGGALEAAGGCAGCSLALLALLFTTAGTAMALFR